MGFPKYVYKRGTGKQVNDAGLFTAESELVASTEAFAALGPGWCESPIEAAILDTPKLEAKPEPKAEAEKPAKKVK